MGRPSQAELYVEAANSFISFARTVELEDWCRPVPCTPEWTARDVVGHVVGEVEDFLAGRTDGAGGAAWTAAQVARHAGVDIEALLVGWEARLEPFAAWIADAGATWPAADCHCHEHDLRHALDLPGNRENLVVTTTARRFLCGLAVPFPLEVELDGSVVTNDHPELGRYPHEEVVLRGVSSFEVFRSRLGRRSRAQVEELHWSGPPERIALVVDRWFLLGPSTIAIHE